MNNGTHPVMNITCAKCATVFDATLPPVEIMNGLFVSSISSPHKNLVRCTQCAEPYVLTITGAQVNWGAVSVTPETVTQIEGSPIIKPGLLVPRN